MLELVLTHRPGPESVTLEDLPVAGSKPETVTVSPVGSFAYGLLADRKESLEREVFTRQGQLVEMGGAQVTLTVPRGLADKLGLSEH